jgi:2'-5' RNA ligase
VVLLFDAEVSAEIDGLRRALGEPDLTRIRPHLTLVAPVNVREAEFDAAEATVRAAGAATGPLDLELGPITTFLPDNPVAYLAVGGDVDGVKRLHDAVSQGPLHRESEWPFVPHVTIVDGVDPERIAAAPRVLPEFHKPVRVRAMHVLEEQSHRWVPIAAFPLGPPAVIGRGGQPLELDTVEGDDAVTITAFRDGRRVGTLTGWRRSAIASLERLDVDDDVRRQGIGTHLLAAFQSWAADSDATVYVAPAIELDDAARGFLQARGLHP